MAKMYVFRKLSQLNQQQTDVCKEAISSVLDDILKGKTSTIISFGPVEEKRKEGPKDMVERILKDLFKRVYTMGANMEINISIQHKQLLDKKELKDSDRNVLTWEHFVATTKEVYAYMKKVNPISIFNDCDKHVLFTICVQQTSLEQSIHLQGKLQLIHLKDIYQQMHEDLETEMNSLLKILKVFASNPKTHLRYYNLGLTSILRTLLGSADGTVIFNCTDEKLEQELEKPSTPISSEPWRKLYIKEHIKRKMLNKKLLSLKKKHNKLHQKLKNHKHLKLLEELNEIKENITLSIPEMLDVQLMLPQLEIHFEQLAQQLEHKNQMLSQQHELLAKANEKVQSQRISFQQKLSLYADMFTSLWQQQRCALQLQEQKREMQLSQMFQSIYSELQQEQLESNKVKSG